MEVLIFIMVVVAIYYGFKTLMIVLPEPQAVSYTATNTHNVTFPPDMVIQIPELPDRFDRQYKAFSYNDEDKEYVVNLKNYTCTCPDFTKRRSSYDKHDIRRLCKHIRYKIKQSTAKREYSDLLLDVFSNRYPSRYHFEVKENGTHIIFGHDKKPWVTVNANIDGTITSGSYNILEKRWAYDNPPEHLDVIMPLIKENFKMG